MTLNLGPTEERSPLKFILIAAAIMAAIVAVLYFTTWRKMAEASVIKTDIFAPHTVMKQLPDQIHIVGTLGEEQDNVYVIAHVRLTDKMRLPMFYSTATATMMDTTGASLDAIVISAHDLQRLEQSFPEIAPLATSPFTDGDEFAPDSAREGSVVLLFPHINQSMWSARKSATLTLSFAHQDPLTIPLP